MFFVVGVVFVDGVAVVAVPVIQDVEGVVVAPDVVEGVVVEGVDGFDVVVVVAIENVDGVVVGVGVVVVVVPVVDVVLLKELLRC